MSDFTPADLPRVSERIPYLYLEQCVIKRANNALVAADENGETALPIATIAVLMLARCLNESATPVRLEIA